MSYFRYLCLFEGGLMSYLRYLCLLEGGVMSYLRYLCLFEENSKRQFWQKQAHRHTLDVIISCTLLIQLSSNSVDHRRLYRVHFTTSEKGEPEYVQSKSVIVISCNGLHYGGKHNSIDSQWLKSKGGNTRVLASNENVIWFKSKLLCLLRAIRVVDKCHYMYVSYQ
jgi:uncharacterized membrane protein YecN with MAPEG domain